MTTEAKKIENKTEEKKANVHEIMASYTAKDWQKWEWEELALAVLTAQGHEERKDEIAGIAGRVLRGAYRGYANKKFESMDYEHILGIIEMERAFTIKNRPVPVKKEAVKAEVPPPPAPPAAPKALAAK